MSHSWKQILGLQPCDKAAMLGDKTIKKISQNLHDKTVQFPAEENALFLSTNMAAVTSVASQQLKDWRFWLISERKTYLDSKIQYLRKNRT